jgi:hypothetical protein
MEIIFGIKIYSQFFNRVGLWYKGLTKLIVIDQCVNFLFNSFSTCVATRYAENFRLFSESCTGLVSAGGGTISFNRRHLNNINFIEIVTSSVSLIPLWPQMWRVWGLYPFPLRLSYTSVTCMGSSDTNLSGVWVSVTNNYCGRLDLMISRLFYSLCSLTSRP